MGVCPLGSQNTACFDCLLINTGTVHVIFSAACKSMLDCLPF